MRCDDPTSEAPPRVVAGGQVAVATAEFFRGPAHPVDVATSLNFLGPACPGRVNTVPHPTRYSVRPEPGMMVLFSRYVPHRVLPRQSELQQILITSTLRKETFPRVRPPAAAALNS